MDDHGGSRGTTRRSSNRVTTVAIVLLFLVAGGTWVVIWMRLSSQESAGRSEQQPPSTPRTHVQPVNRTAPVPEHLEKRRERASTDLRYGLQTVRLFQLKEGRLPDESEWPRFLTEGSENRKAPYMDLDEGQKFEDPWGNPYAYRRVKPASKFEILNVFKSDGFEIVSYGPDGLPGSEDDIIMRYPTER